MNQEVKKVLFIINKFAGVGYQPALEGRILKACEKYDIECTIEFTLGKGHATTLAVEAAERGFKQVVAVGGDGTINEVAQGLLNSNTTMGIVPRGSGNGLARHLGIPVRTSSAVESLFKSSPLSMDIFRLNGKLSLNVSGIGFDGHIANLFSGKTKRGLTGYAGLTMKQFYAFKEFDCEISIGSKSFKRTAFIIAIANSSQYGNNARIAPAASVRDELLHINILRKVPAYRFDFVYAFFAGTVAQSKYCEMLEAQALSIRTAVPAPYHVDGEPCGLSQEFVIELTPAALQVLVPHKAIHNSNV